MRSKPADSPTPRVPLLRWAGLAGAVVLGAWLLGAVQDPLAWAVRSQAALTAWVAAQPVLGAAVFLVVATLGKVTPFPGGLAIMFLGGFLFGAVPGAVLSATGAMLSALLVGSVGRRVLSAPIHRYFGHRLRRIEADVTENAFSYLLAVRLLPVVPAWLVNLVPVVFEVRLVPVAVATFVGLLPLSFVVGGVGAGVSDLAQAGTLSAGLVFRLDTVVPLAGLAVLALVPAIVRHMRR